MEKIRESRAAAYARWCVGDDPRVPVYVRKQAAAWLDILDGGSEEAYADEQTYGRICRLLRLMVHPDLGCTMYDGLEDKFGVTVVQCGYDRWNALSTVQKLEAAGMECVEIKQHSSVLHSPTKLLREKILDHAFVYDENLMLEINFQNARCTEDTNLNKYVNKKKSEGKVDMVVSLINAVYLIEQDMLFGDDFVVQT